MPSYLRFRSDEVFATFAAIFVQKQFEFEIAESPGDSKFGTDSSKFNDAVVLDYSFNFIRSVCFVIKR